MLQVKYETRRICLGLEDARGCQTVKSWPAFCFLAFLSFTTTQVTRETILHDQQQQ
jgi:hypothetical protein